jgi:hypothetical protein
VTGLYDDQGVLRFTGRDSDDCLAYAELFGMDPNTYSLARLTPLDPHSARSSVGGFPFDEVP